MKRFLRVLLLLIGGTSFGQKFSANDLLGIYENKEHFFGPYEEKVFASDTAYRLKWDTAHGGALIYAAPNETVCDLEAQFANAGFLFRMLHWMENGRDRARYYTPPGYTVVLYESEYRKWGAMFIVITRLPDNRNLPALIFK